MTPERWRKVEELFHAAADLPASQQSAHLTEACGPDEELRREVASLLAYANRQNNIRSAVVEAAGELGGGAEAWIGRTLGAYRITGVVGRGGMGVVYSAVRDDEQYEKRVAIKLVNRGLDPDILLERFRTERQILAQLEHPYVARLLDGGVTPDGRPYLVMEYIEGVSITRHCEDKKLPAPQRLRLFQKVCEAVDYAHRNLVVHRDLKPDNILITPEGLPKLLDFGVAKLLSPGVPDGPLTLTVETARAMTPDYASPEQIKGERITTATDVYSLGVCLYELLTAVRPHQLREYTLAEIEESVCHRNVLPPSHAVTGDPRRARLLKGDLDNIVLKAMRKEPERRYASAGQLAEDVERYLTGRPVSARPDTTAYRVNKFVRRNKLAVAAAALAVLALVVGGVVTAYQSRKAENRFQQVRSLAKVFLFDMHDQLQNMPGATRVRRFAVDTGLEYLRRLEQEAGGDADLLRELSLGYRKLGDVQGYPLASNLGDSAGAEKSYREAIRILERTPGTGVELIEVHRRLGELLDHRGVAAGAIESYRKGLAAAEVALARSPADLSVMRAEGTLRTSLGRTLFRIGDVKGLAGEASRGAALFEKIAAARPDDAELGDSLATSYRLAATALESSGKWEEAFPYYLKNVEVRRRRVQQEPNNVGLKRQLMLAHSFVGDFLVHQLATPYDPARALDSYRAMLDIADAQARQDPMDHKAKLDLALSLLRMGKALALTGDHDASLDYLNKSLVLTKALLEKEPGSFFLSMNLTHLTERMTFVLSALRRPSEALACSRESIRNAERLVEREPKRAEALGEAMACYRTHLNLAVQSRDTATAQNAMRKLEDLAASAAALNASEPGLISNLARSFAAIAAAKETLGGPRDACPWVRKSAERWEQLRAAGHNGVLLTTEQPAIAKKLAACTTTTAGGGLAAER